MTTYLDNLIRSCENAKRAKPINEFVISDPEQIPNILKGVYIIREINGDAKRTFESFKTFKESNEKSCCKYNHASNVLYVGSSTTGLRKRLRQHLVKYPVKTYSLRLYEKWFQGKYEVQILEYDESREVIQLIEDNISYSLKQAFGKQGGNNK